MPASFPSRTAVVHASTKSDFCKKQRGLRNLVTEHLWVVALPEEAASAPQYPVPQLHGPACGAPATGSASGRRFEFLSVGGPSWERTQHTVTWCGPQAELGFTFANSVL